MVVVRGWRASLVLFFPFGDSLLAVPFVWCCVVCLCCLFLCLFVSVGCRCGSPLRLFVLFRSVPSVFLNFGTFASREEELRTPHGRRRSNGNGLSITIFLHVSPPVEIGTLIKQISEGAGPELSSSLTPAGLVSGSKSATAADYLQEQLKKAGKDGDAMTQDQFTKVVKGVVGTEMEIELPEPVKTSALAVWVR